MYNWIELYQKIIVDKLIIDFKNCTFFLFKISLLKILNINEFSQICIRGEMIWKLRIYEVLRGCFNLS